MLPTYVPMAVFWGLQIRLVIVMSMLKGETHDSHVLAALSVAQRWRGKDTSVDPQRLQRLHMHAELANIV